MKILKTTLFFILSGACLSVNAQYKERGTSLALFAGMINYQGDLKPNSFTFQHANATFGVLVRQPLTSWLSARAGYFFGTIEGADRYNRVYLKFRNLNFYSTIHELQTGFEINLLNPSNHRLIPVVYGGAALFHFNPWTYDNSGVKVHLKPLSTEGQGLSQYPGHRPYKLTQWSLPFGGGFKFSVNDELLIGIGFSQRKSFTDYLDDVSSFYVDEDILLQARGAKAVELAYRGDELPGGAPYPPSGEQRGTPSEMDWYYMLGVTVEMKVSTIADLVSGNGGNSIYNRCPRNLSY